MQIGTVSAVLLWRCVFRFFFCLPAICYHSNKSTVQYDDSVAVNHETESMRSSLKVDEIFQ